jgi:aspartyl-tRNA(Asn)/glutamyl-tRNA(Gln) amidotransferase subunit A
VAAAPELWQARITYGNILLPEARFFHRAALRDRPGDIGADVLARLNRRVDLSAEEMVAAMLQQAAALAELTALLQRFDALAVPTTRIPAPPIAGEQTVIQNGRAVLASAVLTANTAPFDVTGSPALSVPCGFTAAGLPIGLQIAGRRWDEATVLRIGTAYEAATNWHRRVPAL